MAEVHQSRYLPSPADANLHAVAAVISNELLEVRFLRDDGRACWPIRAPTAAQTKWLGIRPNRLRCCPDGACGINDAELFYGPACTISFEDQPESRLIMELV